MYNKLKQFLCGLRGHEEIKTIEGGVIYSVCIRCLHRGPGIRAEESMWLYAQTHAEELYEFLYDHEMQLGMGG